MRVVEFITRESCGIKLAAENECVKYCEKQMQCTLQLDTKFVMAAQEIEKKGILFQHQAARSASFI